MTSGNKTDVVAEFMAACQLQGIKPGIYYSIPDGHNEGGVVQFRGAPVSNKYFQLIKRQITELHSHYPGIREQWLDVVGRLSPKQRVELYELVKRMSPECLIVMNAIGGRTGTMINNRWPSDILGRDRPPVASARHEPHYFFDGQDYYLPLVVADSLGKSWMYRPGDVPKDVNQLKTLWQKTVGCGANLLLNVPPDKSGRIPDEYVAALMAFKEAMKLDSFFQDTPAVQGERLRP
jgi:alpha-L-fucosidase